MSKIITLVIIVAFTLMTLVGATKINRNMAGWETFPILPHSIEEPVMNESAGWETFPILPHSIDKMGTMTS